MKSFWNWLSNLYTTNTQFRGFVQAVEAGVLMGLGSVSLDSSELFTRHGLKHLVVALVSGAIVAIRNYLVNRPGQPAVPLAPLPPPIPIDAPKTQGEKQQ